LCFGFGLKIAGSSKKFSTSSYNKNFSNHIVFKPWFWLKLSKQQIEKYNQQKKIEER
jgi:hypothetical protein